MYHFYILYSKSKDRYYTGISVNPLRRLRYHAIGKGGGKRSYTKRATDWKLVYAKIFLAKGSARRFEIAIKKKKSRKFIEQLIETDCGRVAQLAEQAALNR